MKTVYTLGKKEVFTQVILKFNIVAVTVQQKFECDN
jgi:hypothetical protein